MLSIANKTPGPKSFVIRRVACMYVLNEKNLNHLLVSAILQAFEVDLFLRFWSKSPFLVIDSSRTKHSHNIID